MKTLAVAIDDDEVAQRLREVVGATSNFRFLMTGADSEEISTMLRVESIDVLCMQPGTFDKWLVVREMIAEHDSPKRTTRFALVVEKPDSAFVYRVLAYGVDDLIDLSTSDEALAANMATLADGRGRACARFIVDDVDVPPAMTKQAICYADDVDRRIVPMLAIGYTDREIAHIVNYSHQVIRNRVSRILVESGLRNRTQLAARYTLERLEDRGGGIP